MSAKPAKADSNSNKDKEHAAPAATSSGGGIKGKILIGAFVSLVVVAETVVFFFMVPTGEEIAVLAESRLISAAQEIDAKKEETASDANTIKEFDFGAPFSVPFVPVDSDRMYRVEFRLSGSVRQKDKERLQKLFDERVSRLRHRINLEVRNSSIQELTEVNLGLIQRKILATSTEVLGEALLLSVEFPDYQVLEE